MGDVEKEVGMDLVFAMMMMVGFGAFMVSLKLSFMSANKLKGD